MLSEVKTESVALSARTTTSKTPFETTLLENIMSILRERKCEYSLCLRLQMIVCFYLS